MSDPVISSTRNPRIREVLQLRARKGRRRTGLILIEGHTELLHALKAGIAITSLFLCQEGVVPTARDEELESRARGYGVPCYRVSPSVARKISYGDRVSSALAVAEVQDLSLARLSARVRRPSLVLVLDGFEKPGNVGAAFRVADGAGADAILVSRPVTDSWNPNTVRASLGTVFTLPFAEASAEEALLWCRNSGLRIVVSTPSAEQVYSEEDLTLPCALVVGSEHQGVDFVWADNADSCVKIPMAGNADSLNAAASTGILVYEALRQRSKRPPRNREDFTGESIAGQDER